MMISTKDWLAYINKLSLIDKTAAAKMQAYVQKHGFGDTQALIDYAYGIATKYGEGSAALAAEMYDVIAELSGKHLPPAEVAPTPEYDEVAKAVNGTAKYRNTELVSNAVGRLVKRTGVDTTMKNAIRDGAEWAWIPHGDTCAFCLTLASRGWQKASKAALKGGHAEHIHAHCDCTYAISFDGKPKYAGYDPDKYLKMYEDAEGKTSKDKINAMRRAQYQEMRDKINEQKRAAYASRKGIVDRFKTIIGKAENPDEKLKNVLNQAYETHRIRNGLVATPLKELGERSPIRIEFKNLSEKTQESFTETIAALVKEYDTTLQGVRSMTPEEALLQFKHSFACVSHEYTVDSSVLLINPTKCKDYDKMVDRIRDLSRRNYCVSIAPDKAGEYVATHEFAHTLINMVDELNDKTNWLQADYDTIRKARKEIESIFDEYIKKCKALETKAKDLELKSINALTKGTMEDAMQLGEEAARAYDELKATKISEYSLANSDEFMAESFTNERIGVKSNAYAKRVTKIINKYFRR